MRSFFFHMPSQGIQLQLYVSTEDAVNSLSGCTARRNNLLCSLIIGFWTRTRFSFVYSGRQNQQKMYVSRSQKGEKECVIEAKQQTFLHLENSGFFGEIKWSPFSVSLTFKQWIFRKTSDAESADASPGFYNLNNDIWQHRASDCLQLRDIWTEPNTDRWQKTCAGVQKAAI